MAKIGSRGPKKDDSGGQKGSFLAWLPIKGSKRSISGGPKRILKSLKSAKSHSKTAKTGPKGQKGRFWRAKRVVFPKICTWKAPKRSISGGPKRILKSLKSAKSHSKTAKITFLQQIASEGPKLVQNRFEGPKSVPRGQKRTILEVKKEVQNRSKIGPKSRNRF